MTVSEEASSTRLDVIRVIIQVDWNTNDQGDQELRSDRKNK